MSKNEYPDDADGDALRRVSCHADMSKPMAIEFQVVLPNEQSANQFAIAAQKLGYHVRIYSEEEAWECECSTRMLATYDGVIAIQDELASLSSPFGGRTDGWGTFGNSST